MNPYLNSLSTALPTSQNEGIKYLILALLFWGINLYSYDAFAQTDSVEEPPTEVEVYVADFAEREIRKNIEHSAGKLLSAINVAYLEGQTPELTDEVFEEEIQESVISLWESHAFFFPDARIIESISLRTNGNFEMRGIAMYLAPNEEEEPVYEEAVLQFDPQGNIKGLRIGLAEHRYQELMRQAQDDVDDANRRQILDFVESFRTAYNKKDIEFIENVFSDQALIIVGRVVESTGEESPYEKQVEYLQYNKSEYIDRLASVFEANAWIDVGFEEISIFRHPRHTDMYGVSLTQYYNSEIYSDVGFLFLLIDFRDPQEPMIHVRTWQPKNDTPEGEFFSIGDMEIF